MGENINAYWDLMGNTEGRRPFGRPRSRWRDSIKQLARKGMDVIHLAHGRVL
jgi:hypothetical protein